MLYLDFYLFYFQTPKKDHEVVITSRMANEDFFRMIYYVTRGNTDNVQTALEV